MFISRTNFDRLRESEECKKDERKSLLIYKLIRASNIGELELFKVAVKEVAWPKAVIDRLVWKSVN